MMSKFLGRFSMQRFLDMFSRGGWATIAKVVVPSYFFYIICTIAFTSCEKKHGKCYCHWQIG